MWFYLSNCSLQGQIYVDAMAPTVKFFGQLVYKEFLLYCSDHFLYVKWNFFSANKLNKDHMNIKLLVWFIWNDFKFIFFSSEVWVRTGQKWSHLQRGQNDQITGRDVGNCT